MNMNITTNNDIVLFEQSQVEQRPPVLTRQYKISTLNVDDIERMFDDDDSITDLTDISRNCITAYWSKHQSFQAACALAVFTSLAITIGILTVCFTSPKKTNGPCEINFERTTEPAIGYDSNPRYAAVHDFNQDNYLDIVVANSGTDNIGVFLGYGNGTFADQIKYSTGLSSQPYALAVGDFNNDTLVDVVVANYGTNSIGVLFNDGNASFASPIITSLGSSRPVSLAVADFNKDKQLDVAVVNYGTSSVSVLLGSNNGSFRIDQTFHMDYDSVPYSVATADLNQDDQIDIVVVNYGTSTLVTLLANGNGSFTSHQYSTGSGSHPSSVVIDDYNNDTILDIAVANSGTSNIGIFLGHGNETFINMMIQPLDSSSSSPQFIVVSDFDKDDILDMVVADARNNDVVVLKGHGNGSFSMITTHSTGYNSDPCSIAVGDFDNDNRSDIAIANNGINSILVLTTYAIHLDTTQMIYSTGDESFPISVAVGDFNQDNHLDIAVANFQSNNIGIFFGFGNGNFGSQEIFFTRENSAMSFVIVDDFNSDNQSDIVFVMTGTSEIGILLEYKNGSFRNEQTYSTGDNSSPESIAVGDLDNDGNLDIVVANYNTKNAGIFFGHGNGNFTDVTTFFLGSNFYPRAVGVGDFNSDNILDIMVTTYRRNDIVILLRYGNGSYFISMIVSNDDYSSSYVSIGDLNKDNHLDVVYTSPFVSTIGVLLGYGNGTFENVIRYSTGSGAWPWSVILCDFNNDTLMDIAISNSYDYNVGIFFGLGNGSFSAQKTFSTGYDSRSTGIATGDFNGDHQPDIVVSNYDTNNIGVFLAHYDAGFTDGASYFTGSGPHPYSVAVGDFDKNGQSDIVVANSGNDNIQILLGYNKGVFMNNGIYSTDFGSYPQFVTVADFNKDTQVDIAVANVGNDSINVFVGFGNGTFDTPTVHSIDSGSFPSSIAVGDLNNDSWMDIVIANQDKDNIGVFLGFDYPTFTNETIDISGFSAQPSCVAVGDFNHDHHWDIVTADIGSDTVGVLLGYGNGTFSEPMLYSSGSSSSPRSIGVGDFNNDTHLDTVVANTGKNTIGIFLGYGNGSFRAQRTYSTGGSSLPRSVAVGDLNKDNIMDIVVANRDSDSVGVFLGYGNGTFAVQVPYSMPDDSSPMSVALGDFNSDSILDIVVANYAKDNIGILLGYGDGTFQDVTMYSTGESFRPYSIATGDLNKDRWMDIAVACDKNIGVFFGYGNGTFSSQTTYSTGSQSDLYAIIVTDLNNDTILDIAVADYGSGDGNIGVLYGYGDGNFTVLKIYSTGFYSDPSSIAVCDFDNDDRVDLAISYVNDDRIGIMLRSKSEPFATLSTFSTGNNSRPKSVAVGDLNNDNQLDIVTANFGTNNIGLLLGHGNGTFTQQQTYSTGNNSRPIAVAVGHMNNDNQLDIVVANSDTNNILIFLGSHDRTFTILTTYPTGQSSAPSSIVVNDLNKDNHLDIVVSTYGTNKLFVFFGFGNGTFFEPKSYSLGYNARPESVTIGDFNNDTLLDIAVANSETDYVEILLQTCEHRT